MIVYNQKRDSGKTARLIYISDYTRYPILVSNLLRKRTILEMSKSLLCDIPEPITVEELRMCPTIGKNILCDEETSVFSEVMSRYFGASVVVSTDTQPMR